MSEASGVGGVCTGAADRRSDSGRPARPPRSAGPVRGVEGVHQTRQQPGAGIGLAG